MTTHLSFLVLTVAGWMNRGQQAALDYVSKRVRRAGRSHRACHRSARDSSPLCEETLHIQRQAERQYLLPLTRRNGVNRKHTDPKGAFPTFPTNLLLMKGQQVLGSMGGSRGEKIDDMVQMVQDGRLHAASAVTSGASKPYTVHEFERAFSDVATRKGIGRAIITINS